MDIVVYRFSIDRMLAGLARKLLILGHDTYLRTENDTLRAFLTRALEEDRILITTSVRTYNIFKGSKRYASLKFILARSEDPHKLLEGLVGLGFNFERELVLKRCTICNYPLEEVKDHSCAEVPEYVKRKFSTLWYCRSCGRYYWPGSHYMRMLKSVERYIES